MRSASFLEIAPVLFNRATVCPSGWALSSASGTVSASLDRRASSSTVAVVVIADRSNGKVGYEDEAIRRRERGDHSNDYSLQLLLQQVRANDIKTTGHAAGRLLEE